MKVRLRKGFHVKTDAETIYNAAEAARDENGNIDHKAIFEAAKPKNAPLHDEFEWDKTKAWQAYNINRARYLLQSIIVEDERKDSEPVRAFESVTVVDNSEPGADGPPRSRLVFRRTEDIMRDPVQRNELLMQALRDAAAYRKRYAGLQELAQVFHAIDATIAKTEAA